LIPREKLISEKNKLIKINSGLKEVISSEKIDKKTIDGYMASPIAKIFGVSEEAAEISLTRGICAYNSSGALTRVAL